MKKNELGLIGLAVMGQNLAMNIADNGYAVAVYNRSADKTMAFIAGSKKACGRPENLSPVYDLQEFVASLERPRRVLLMVQAGAAVDAVIDSLLPFLEEGDLIADLGNSYFRDTIRREQQLAAKGLLFAGVGVSGGEEGARRGPSIMPGGNRDAQNLLERVFHSISAEVREPDGQQIRCSKWIGRGGSGHFVKMVHNGIEYGDMEIISEAYHIMTAPKGGGGFVLSNAEAADAFTAWNSTELAGFLNEITADILRYREANGDALIDRILDAAGQKGTGKWTVEESFDLLRPVTVISQAVFARGLSAMKKQRVKASGILKNDTTSGFAATHPQEDKEKTLQDLADAMLASRIISYTQGFSLIQAASEKYGWDLQAADLAEIWQGGCIIRSALLTPIKQAFTKNPTLESLLFDDHFAELIGRLAPGWRRTAARAMLWGIPVPGITAALSFYDGFRSAHLPANMIQAQRDYFGGHMYERVDRQRGEWFHTDWTGHGGKTASTAYNA